MIEREIKLALPGRFAIPPLFVDDEPLTIVDLPELALRATYFDTRDLRLARHGVTLRHRTGEPGGPMWTLKLSHATVGSTLERIELHFADARRDPPPEARALVTALARREPLVAVATLRTRRRLVRVMLDDFALAELADDEVSVIERRRVVSRFRELELEALAEGADLEPLAEQLRRAGATDVEPIPKVVRALGSRATAPSDIARVTVPPDPTMADALAMAISDALVRLVHQDPLARLGDVEGLHQVRVALRRLRSDLRTLGDAVDPGWRARVEPGLRAIAGALGDARDLDVLVNRLRADVEPAQTGNLAPLFDDLQSRRERAQAEVQAALDGESYAVLLDQLVEASASPPAGIGSTAHADTVLPAHVIRAWGSLARRASALDNSSPDADFHRVRIAAKRVRYVAELASGVLGGKRATGAAALAAKVVGLQDWLGALQDAAVAEQAIREAVTSADVIPPYAFEAGRLVERQRARAAAARAGFLDAWPEASRRRWRKWAS